MYYKFTFLITTVYADTPKQWKCIAMDSTAALVQVAHAFTGVKTIEILDATEYYVDKL